MKIIRIIQTGIRLRVFTALLVGLAGCGDRQQPPAAVSRQFTPSSVDFGQLGHRQRVYVPIYAEVFYNANDQYYPLITTLSVRNTSLRDSLYVNTVDYYDTKGSRLKRYIAKTIVLRPLETVDFPVTYADQGGTGANFIVDWGCRNRISPPVVQAVTVGSAYKMGFSWITNGVTTDSL